jgi:hypothetical protein
MPKVKTFDLALAEIVYPADADESRPIRFQVLTAADADAVSESAGNDRPGRGRPRVFAECDHPGCGAWISAGRFNQHYAKHALAVS